MASISTTQTATVPTVLPPTPTPNVDKDKKFKSSQRTINKDRIAKYGIDPNKGLNADIPYLPTTSDAGASETVTTVNSTVAVDSLVEQGNKLLQGESVIGIAPFDNYYMFSIFTEKDGVDIPLDLSNAGNLYLTFSSNTEEVRIKNYTQSTTFDIAQGQVVFRISKEDAKKILSFANNSFYITAKKELDNFTSDETVLFTGKYHEYNELYQDTLRLEYENYKITAQTQILQLQGTLSALDETYAELKMKYMESLDINAKLQTKIDEFNALIDKYKTYLTSDTVNTLNTETKFVQSNTNINPNTDPKTTANINENTNVTNDPNVYVLRKSIAKTTYNTNTKKQQS